MGECKLFATLHALKLIKPTVMDEFPALSAFYERFAAEPKTAELLENGAEFPEAFKQYFVPGEEQA